MYSECIICTDRMSPDEELYVTRCGHLFHRGCLMRWIETSKTCPQCRNATTTNCVFRFYPNVPSQSGEDESAALQSLAEAQAQLREKEAKLKALNDDLKRKEELLKSYEQKLQQARPNSGQTNRGEVSAADEPSTSRGSNLMRNSSRTTEQPAAPAPAQSRLQPLPLLQPIPYLTMPRDLQKDLENALNAALQKDLQYKIRKLRHNHLDTLG